jgi:Secretion system C-terminal sorting domain
LINFILQFHYMRILISIVFSSLFIYSIPMSQVLNPSFELWTTVSPGTNYEYIYPTNWMPTGNQSFSKSTIAHTGTYSCRGAVVISALSAYSVDTTVPMLIGRFYMAQHYAKLTGYYQFLSANNCIRSKGSAPVPCNDSLLILSVGTTSQGAGAEGMLRLGSATTWTSFSIPLAYALNVYPVGTKPDSITIEIMMSPHDYGSYFLIDDLNFEGTATNTVESSIKLGSRKSLGRNYPNPFAYSTQIEFIVPTNQSVSLNIFNSLGREVKTIINDEMKIAGDYKETIDLSREPNGLYLFKLQIGNTVETHTMSKTDCR